MPGTTLQCLPVSNVDETISSDLEALLMHITRRLTPFTGSARPTALGVQVDLHDPDTGTRIRMTPFCQCASRTCPHCVSALDRHAGYSSHDLLKLAPIFEESGFVPGAGAPNFHYLDGTTDIRIWWHELIGRDMRCHPALTGSDVATLTQRIACILPRIELAQVKDDLDSALSTLDGPIPAQSLAGIRAGFIARLKACDSDARLARYAEIRLALSDLTRLAEAYRDLSRVGDILDAHGIARHDDPAAPQDLRQEFTAAHRLTCLLSGRDPADADIFPF